MGSTITNRDRQAIITQLIARALGEKKAAHKAAGQKLFDECCDDFCGPHKDTLNALPLGFISERIRLTFPYQFGGLPLSYNSRELEGAFPRRLPAQISIGNDDFENSDDSDEADHGHSVPLSKEMRRKALAWFKKGLDLEAEESELESDIGGMLLGTRSWKKLFEMWPELAELKLAAAPPPEATGKQISINLPELNKKLRLPPGEKEE